MSNRNIGKKSCWLKMFDQQNFGQKENMVQENLIKKNL